MNAEDLKKPFAEELFLKLNSQLVNAEMTKSQLSISSDNSQLINAAQYFGSFDDLDLHILSIEHSGTEDARVGVSMEIFKLMKKYSFQNALVAGYTRSTNSWRYSLVTSSLSINEKGKITKEFSNPRRYSFVLGPNQKILTPFKQLIQSGKVLSLKELSKRFSLEVVNNEFYKEIAALYDELVGTDTISRKLTYPNAGDESHEFAVRLIGRIIFCWFLREKKSKSGLSLVPSQILSREAASQMGYYHNTLAPLFFEVLNRPIPKRRNEKFKTSLYANIPYLNGGLFSDDGIDYYKFDKSLGLSVPGLVDVPDVWLHKLLDLLERFNFTVDENTSYDTDLSIDPEMLGRVFENLLARINPETGETVRKSTGSFYTPREIVDYMVDSSLSEYLLDKTGISKAKIHALISYDIFDDLGKELSAEEEVSVLQALSSLTVLDPACGSGAFPIGMLQKIVFIITKLDPDAKWWLAKQLEGASPELRREFANKSVDYVRKLGVIRQTIFGVDIQPIATEIARLRCFLTLIVDEAIYDSEDNRGIRSLPNLEFKFVTANSLLVLPEQKFSNGHVQQDMFDNSQREKIEKLKILIDDYFSASSGDKSEIKAEYRYVQNKLWDDMHKSSAYGQQSLALTGWDPFDHKASNWFDPEWMFGITEGFDVVIGNPPYGVRFSDEEKKVLRVLYPETQFKIDSYSLFILRATQQLNDNGKCTYIIPNTFLDNYFEEKVRTKLLREYVISQIVDLDDKVFSTATVHSMILMFANTKKTNYEVNIDISNTLNNQFITIPNTYFLESEKATISLRDYEMRDLIKKFNLGSKNLEDLLDIRQSIKTGDDNKYITNTQENYGFKPILRGKDIGRYQKKSPNLFVNYGKHLACPRDYKIFEQPKILIREAGNKITATFDDQNFYIMSSIYCCILKDSNFDLKYLLGLLNSNLFQFLMHNLTFAKTEGAFTKAKIFHYYKLPVRDVSRNAQLPIINIVDKILSAKEKNIDNSSINELEIELNKIIYDLYDLQPEEITVIEGKPNRVTE